MASGMYERVVRIISKHPKERKVLEIESLLEWFKKKAVLFAGLSTDVVVDILRNCDFVTHERDYTLIKQGERGDCFFILLRGKVSVYISHSIADEEDPEKLQEFISQLGSFNDKGELDRTKFGNHIVGLGEGKSFGELALINENCIRNASILVDETSDLVVVNRELYYRSLHAIAAAEFEEKNSFTRESQVFRGWQVRYKKQLAMSLRKEKIQFDNCITRQGDPTNVLYFILKGQAKIVVDPSQHAVQYPQFYPLEVTDWILTQSDSDEEDSFGSKKKELPQPVVKEEPPPMCPHALRRREKPRKLIELSIVGPNEVIGDTEFVLELKTYMHTVLCTQDCEVLCLDRKNYERLVAKRNPSTVNLLRQGAEVKHTCRITRLHEIKVPILRTLLYKMQSIDKQPAQKVSKKLVKQNKINLGTPYDAFVPTRGALIDMYGPGTVFHRTRMREKAKRKIQNSRGFNSQRIPNDQRKDTGRGPYAALPPPAAATPDHVKFEGELVGQCPHQEVFITKSEVGSDSGEDDGRHRQIPIHPSVFKDFKSSDHALSILEDKIKGWHAAVTSDLNERANNLQPFKLRRVTIDEGKELVPGSRVVIRKKKPGKVFPEHGAEEGSNSRNGNARQSSTKQSSEVTIRHAHVHQRPFSVNDAYRSRLLSDSEGDSGSGPQTTIHGGGVSVSKAKNDKEPKVNGIPGNFLIHPKILSAQGLRFDNYGGADSVMSDGDDIDPEFPGTILDILRHRQKLTVNSWKSKTQNCLLSPSLINALKPVVLRERPAQGKGMPRLTVLNSLDRGANRTESRGSRRNSLGSIKQLPKLRMVPRRFSLTGASRDASTLSTLALPNQSDSEVHHNSNLAIH